MTSKALMPKSIQIISVTLLGKEEVPLRTEEILIKPSGQHTIKEILKLIGAIEPEETSISTQERSCWRDQWGFYFETSPANQADIERFGESLPLSSDNSISYRLEVNRPSPVAIQENSCLIPLVSTLSETCQFIQIIPISCQKEQFQSFFNVLTAPPLNRIPFFEGDSCYIAPLNHIQEMLRIYAIESNLDLQNVLSKASEKVKKQHIVGACVMFEISDNDSVKQPVFALDLSADMFTYADIVTLSNKEIRRNKHQEGVEELFVSLSDLSKHHLLPHSRRLINVIAGLANNDIQPFSYLYLEGMVRKLSD